MLKMKTRKPANWLSWVFGILLILPLIYVAFCWWVGLNYGREPIESGVYKVWMSTEIHDAMKRGEALWGVVLDLEGSKKEDLEIKKRAAKPGPFQRILDYVYEEREIMFSYPRTEIVTFPNKESGFGDGNYRERKYEVLYYTGYADFFASPPKKPWQYCVVSEKDIEEMSKDDFLKNVPIQDAVVRRIEIIGEAIRYLPPEVKKESSDVPWQDIMDMRNKIIHEYFGVDLELVLEVVQKDIPELKGKVEEITLGRDVHAGQKLQYVVPAGLWFGSYPAKDTQFSFVGCTVAPGFDFADLEMAKKEDLLKHYPQAKKTIEFLAT